MASSGKKKTTMAKLARESRLRERRLEKQARKEARKNAPEPNPESFEVDAIAGAYPTTAAGEPALGPRVPPPAGVDGA
jgi:hypothetical protein